MLTHDDMREMHFERERRRMSEVRLPPEGKITVTPSQLGNYPIAEQTAIAADCIRECTAYLAELKLTYVAIAEAESELDVTIGNDLATMARSIETLTQSIAKIIDRLPVGKQV